MKIKCDECKQPDGFCLRSYPENSKTTTHFISDVDVIFNDKITESEIRMFSEGEKKWGARSTLGGFVILDEPTLTFALKALKNKNIELDPKSLLSKLDGAINDVYKRFIDTTPNANKFVASDILNDPMLLKTYFGLTVKRHDINELAFRAKLGPCLVSVQDKRVKKVVVDKINESNEVTFSECFHKRRITIAWDQFEKIISGEPFFQIEDQASRVLKVETKWSPSQGTGSPKSSTSPSFPRTNSSSSLLGENRPLSRSSSSGSSTSSIQEEEGEGENPMMPARPRFRSRTSSMKEVIQEDGD